MTKQEYMDILGKHTTDEVLLEEDDWEVLYRLSPIRKNIISWYDFEKEKSILDIGCRTGAVTEVFCEKGLKVTVIENSEIELKLCQERLYPYRENMIYLSEPSEAQAGSYEYVSLIGTLENVVQYVKGEDPIQHLMNFAKKSLKLSGKMFVAFDNKYAIRSYAGMPDLHTGKLFEGIQGYPGESVRAFSCQEIEYKIRKAGFDKIEYYYPFPDYELPLQIFSDKYLPKMDEITESAASYKWPRMQLFDEVLAYSSICKDGLFPQFSNSYLMVCE